MLTKDLIEHRVRKGRVYPSFVDAADRELLALATELVAVVDEGVGERRGDLQETLQTLAGRGARPKVAKGLVKLLFDRMDFVDPGGDAAALRADVFGAAFSVLAGVEDGATLDDYVAAVGSRMGQAPDGLRAALYADLEDERPLASWRAVDGRGLLERYNLALVQGCLLFADRIELYVPSPDLLELRRVLRHLRFCRLVSEVERDGEALRVTVDGPAAVLDTQKKYGLQLASFFSVVPVLSRYSVKATVRLPRRPEAELSLDQSAPLVSHHRRALGHLPEELLQLQVRVGAELPEWRLDATPEIRPSGPTGALVPDFHLEHGATGRRVAVELFHPWHRHTLARRLEERRLRPDPDLILGVDRKLGAEVDGDPKIFAFTSFPSARALKKAVES